MAFPVECFDPETLHLMSRALDAAWDEVELMLADNTVDPKGLRTVMAVRIMAAVRDGEHDPNRLKELALDPIAKAY
jgi:hypothetical protein